MQTCRYSGMHQKKLFGTNRSLPGGMIYRPEFITNTDDFTLLQKIYNLPLLEANHKFAADLSDAIPGNKIAP